MVGFGGTGIFAQSAGVNTVEGELDIGKGIGGAGTGTYTLSGGLVRAAGNVFVGGSSGGAGFGGSDVHR